MKKSKFTETQIVAILQQADAGVPIKDILPDRLRSARRRTTSGRANTAAWKRRI
jgi:hypothetical protein